MKNLKAMYRKGTILARNNSMELTLRGSFSEIAAINRDPSRATAIGFNPSIGSRQSLRGITALSL
jgi:hypothetical protein